MSHSFDVKNIADLARIAITEREAQEFAEGFESILSYIDEIKNVDPSYTRTIEHARPLLRNVLREDENPYESGVFTEALLDEAPARENNYIKVKKMIGGGDNS